MRSFAIFLGLIALGLAGMAALGYPVWLLIAPHIDNPKFHRIAGRVGMLIVAIGFLFVARRLKVADRDSLGYGLPAGRFIVEVAKALCLGTLLMVPALLTMIVLGLRTGFGESLTTGQWLHFLLGGLATGLVVAFIEETFLRGAMQTAIGRESGARLAILLPSLLYAATHFIGRYRLAAADVDAGSGLDMLSGTLILFAHPLDILDAFLCLTAVGILLGMVRELTGNIAACIGLHASWVAVISAVRDVSHRNPDSSAPWLLSHYDGFVGWLVLGWTLAIGWSLWWWYRPHRKMGTFSVS
jgi:CAAX protease family protein